MLSKAEWEPTERGGEALTTQSLTLFVEPCGDGFMYRVGGKWLLRWSRQPLPLAEAKAKCIKAAVKLLRDEIQTLEGV